MGFHSPLRKAHLQPSSTAQPPSSFSRQSGSTFRQSLRKIPSSIFTRGDQSKKEMERKKSMNRLNEENMPRVVKVPMVESAGVKEKEKKVKTKTRKALGELFGWGNSSSVAAAHPVPSAPSPLRPRAPTPPSKFPTPPVKDATVLRKPPPSAITRKASTNTFGTTTSVLTASVLRAPSPANYGRPSMGDDPFGRAGQGAEVVERVPKRDTQTPSIKSDFSAERRRDSVHSGKALSTKTMASDEVSVHEVAMRARMSSPRRVTMASVIEEKKRMSNSPPRPISSTAPTLHPLIAPPPRSDSLSFNYDKPVPSIPAPAPRVRVHNAPIVLNEPISAPPVSFSRPMEKKPSMLGLKRDKTKSRVWGFLGKKVKTKEDKEDDISRAEIEHVPVRPLGLGITTQLLRHEPSQASMIPARFEAPPRAAVPVFHISHPSVDISSTGCTDSPSPAPKILRPALTNNSLIVNPALANKRDSGSTIVSITDYLEDDTGSEGARQCAQFLAGSKTLPKRKSLNGLFGLSIKRSSSDLQEPPVSAKSFVSDQSAFEWTPPKLRPLSEELEEITFGEAKPLLAVQKEDTKAAVPDPGLRRVASATDKLISLVTTFDFSPSPAQTRPGGMSSYTSLKHRISNSPTPIRKVQSAMLFNKASDSPVKPHTKIISPLKLVLQKAHVRKMEGVSVFGEKPVDPEPTSLVKKGITNPFAPPSPERGSPVPKVQIKLQSSPVKARKRAPMAFGPAMGLAGFMDEIEDEDGGLPADLKAIFKGRDNLPNLALPLASQGRMIPSLPVRAAPKISLPPVPTLPSPARLSEMKPVTMPLAVDINSVTSRVFEDEYTTPTADNRNSFDFTSEYEELDRGTHRASFVEALQRVGSSDILGQQYDLPSLPPLPAALHTIEQSPDSVKTLREASSGRFDDAAETKRSPIRQRKAPFQGTFAFQQHVSQNKGGLAVTPPLEIPAPAQEDAPKRWQRSHKRGESGLSIATLSSVGDVIDTAEMDREYTNYFEVNFAQHLAKGEKRSVHDRNASIASSIVEKIDRRAPTRRANHHRRNSSVMSVESIGARAPPSAAFNKNRRSGYISKHRREGSTDSAWGRSDWASHRRNESTDSNASAVSVAKINRPGLGERMFQLDTAVQLSTIAGSPADMPTHSRAQSFDSLDQIGEVSYDTFFDGSQRQASFDSLFDAATSSTAAEEKRHSSITVSTDKRSSGSAESIFGYDAEEAVIQQGFFLRGVRPMSAVSSGMSSETGEDTFIDVKKYNKRVVKEECFEGEGEDRMTPIQDTLNRSTGQHSLSGSISRPAKPQSARRRRPAHRIFASDPDTPGLTSPSTSETSSRLSLETRFSSEVGMYGLGHVRQKSSAHVKTQAMIKEEISMATLRPSSPKIRTQLSRENLRRQDARVLVSDEEDDDESIESITAWLRFQREADEVCKRTKSDFRDSVESKAAVAEFQARFSPQSVADFLAKSAASYKPLEQHSPAASRQQAHRRKSSLADARLIVSPYGLPVHNPMPPRPKRGSLTTKFERSNSATSNRSSEDGVSTPNTGIFAHLMSDLVPSPRAPAQRAASTGPSPFSKFLPHRSDNPGDIFNLAATTSTSIVRGGKASAPPMRTTQPLANKMDNQAIGLWDNRARVDSGTRRKALGWGRRRTSDGPDQVMQSKVVPVGSAQKVASKQMLMKDKENAGVPPLPSHRPQAKMSARKMAPVRPALRVASSGKAMRA